MFLEIPQRKKIYISVSCQPVCQRTTYMKTLVSNSHFFEPSSSRGGTFSNLIMHGDIPSSHGDIPVVPFQFHEVESAKTHILVLSKFQLYGVCLWLLLVSGTQVSWLVRTLCPDSPSICKCIFWVLFFISYLILAASRLTFHIHDRNFQ